MEFAAFIWYDWARSERGFNKILNKSTMGVVRTE